MANTTGTLQINVRTNSTTGQIVVESALDAINASPSEPAALPPTLAEAAAYARTHHRRCSGTARYASGVTEPCGICALIDAAERAPNADEVALRAVLMAGPSPELFRDLALWLDAVDATLPEVQNGGALQERLRRYGAILDAVWVAPPDDLCPICAESVPGGVAGLTVHISARHLDARSDEEIERGAAILSEALALARGETTAPENVAVTPPKPKRKRRDPFGDSVPDDDTSSS